LVIEVMDPLEELRLDHLEQTVKLLQTRLEEQEERTRHWLAVVRRQNKVVDLARQTVAVLSAALDDLEEAGKWSV
jgi:hypothetical protein